jgi:hypothetical protein
MRKHLTDDVNEKSYFGVTIWFSLLTDAFGMSLYTNVSYKGSSSSAATAAATQL